MSAQLIVAGLDLGAHAVKCVIGLHHEDGQLDIIGTGSHPARGFQMVSCQTGNWPSNPSVLSGKPR